MIRVILHDLKQSLILFIQRQKIRLRFYSLSGSIGRSAVLLNPEFIEIGKNVIIKNGYRIECYKSFADIKLNPKLIFGDGVIIGPGFTGFVADRVEIKTNTILAGNVSIISENHGIDPESEIPYHAQPLTTGKVEIGKGCWIGQNVSILPNVVIGDKCIIGANSVVTKNVPSYSIAVGSPVKVIKEYDFKQHKWTKVK